MPNIIDAAPAANPLTLKDTKAAFFMQKNNPTYPAVVSVPGSSRLDLSLFNATATGSVRAAVPGTLVIALCGSAKPNGDDVELLPLAASIPEPIGGPNDLEETMWMIEGSDLMIFTASGKLQGTFKTNIASNPQAPLDLQQHPTDISQTDPLYIFGIAASFVPTGDASSRRKRQKAGDGEEEPTLCTVELASFTLNA